MAKTKIQWATDVWNPITGCDPVSAGCDHCYARRMANRLRGRFGYPQDDPFKVTLHPERVDEFVGPPKNHPYRWRKPRMIFCCSMGDFFHPQVPLEFQARMLDVMVKCPQHIFIILTKRHKQLAIFNEVCGWSAESYPNIWLGVSVEDQKTADERIPILLQVPAAVRVVSIEPMLGEVDLGDYLDCGHETGGAQGWQPDPSLDWVVVGGETGPRARPMHPEWPQAVKNQCVDAGVPFFFKSWGEFSPEFDGKSKYVNVHIGVAMDEPAPMYPVGKKQAGRLLDGREYNEIPEGM